VKWTVESQVSWLDTVAEARKVYTVSLKQLRGALRGKKLGIIFDNDTPYYDTSVEAWWTKADLKFLVSSKITNQ
jgi:FMN-dependent NADH-azoreductase